MRVTIIMILLTILLMSCQAREEATDGVQDDPPERLEDVRIALHVAHDSAATGMQESEVRGEGERIYLDPSAVVDNRHIRAAEVAESDFGNGLRLLLTDEGQRRLGEATVANVGRRMAVMIGDEIVSAPVIRDAMDTRQLLITGSLTAEEIEWIVASLDPPERP